MNVSSEDIVQSIAEVLRRQPSVNNDGAYIFEYFRHQLPPLESDKVSSMAEAITSFDEGLDGSLMTKTSYEVAVQSSRTVPSRAWREEMSLDDSHSGISYRLGPPSDAYAVYACLRILESIDHRQRPMIFRQSVIMRDRIARGEVSSVLDVVKSMLRARTLTITSDLQRPSTGWKQYADAFFFHVGYNLDLPLMPDRNWAELLRPAKISGMRRSEHAELDAPRRHYVPDLVYHYQLGLSAESPMLEYISYYHVAEHWFENIYQDDLVEQIQLAITSPSFSL